MSDKSYDVEAELTRAIQQRGPLVLWGDEDGGIAWAWGRIPDEGQPGDGRAETLPDALALAPLYTRFTDVIEALTQQSDVQFHRIPVPICARNKPMRCGAPIDCAARGCIGKWNLP